MKGIRFYEEYRDQYTRKESAGTVVAVDVECWTRQNLGDRWGVVYDAVVAVFTGRNSPVASSGVAQEYLREWCRRVPESRAREVHPRLFEWLDMEDSNHVA